MNNNENLVSLLYTSSATYLFNEEDLLKLLQKSQAYNEQVGITGMLLYKGGNFMQAIEGPDAAVKELFAKILDDHRHKRITVLSKEPIPSRQFENWAMGFQNIDQLTAEESRGFTNFLTDSLTAEAYRQNPLRAYILLLSFRDNMR